MSRLATFLLLPGRWLRRTVWLLVGVAGVVSSTVRAADVAEPAVAPGPRVLLLASYGFGRIGIEAYITAFQRRLTQLGLPPAQLHVEYLGLEDVPRPDVVPLRKALLESHLRRHPPDLLVVMQQPAMDFVLNQLPELVARTPVLAVLARWPQGQALPPRGVLFQLDTVDAAGTLAQAMALFPDTRRVLAVVGHGEQDRLFQRQIEAAAQAWSERVEFSYTDQLSVAEVEDRVTRLSPGTLLLMGSAVVDRDGHPVVMLEWASRLSQLSRVPMLSLFREVTPTRMLGGSVVEFDAEARRAAERVWSTLGERAPWPAPQELMPLRATPIYNWAEIERWGARPERLPAHTQWVNRPLSLWDEHRSAVAAAAAVLLTLLLAVTVLVRQNGQRRAAEQAARQSEARQRVLTDYAPDGLLVLDTETGFFIDANPAALALFEARRDQIVGARPVDLYLPDQPVDDASPEAIARNNARVMAGERLQLRRWIKTVGGTRKICRVDLVRLPDEHRRLVRSSFTDITELMREREALRVSEERWHFALEGAGTGVWDLDLQTLESPVSRRFCEILGYTLDEYVARRDAWRLLVHPEDLPRIEQRMRDYLDGRSPRYDSEYRMRCKDGSWKWVQTLGMVAARDEHGKPLRVVGTMTDISERRQAEASLQLASMVYRYSAECMMVGDVNGVLVAVNHAFVELLGYSEAQAIGTNVRRLWVKERCHAALQALDRQMRLGGSWRGNLWVRARSGAALEVQMSASTIVADSPTQTRYVALFSDVTEQRAAQHRIWEQANFDDLTGLPNRRQLSARIETLLQADGAQLCVLGIDLDHFKTVNDTLGREVADRLLCEAAQRLRRMLRGDDLAARLGADEFVVVLGTATDDEQTRHFAGQVVEAMREPFVLGEHRIFLSASVGVALAPLHGRQAEDLLRHAGQALGSAKEQGRDRFSVYTADLQALADRRMLVARDLREAVQHGQLQLVYQPIVALASGEVHKAEALLRWSHPNHPGIGPAEFIPIAEQSGLIVPIGDWVFARAVEQVARWQRTLDPGFQLSINRSPAQFNGSRNEDDHLMETLLAHGVAGSGVVMEITEGLLLDGNERIRDNLGRLRAAGIGVSIDDFGTGYSSLAYVQKFAIDFIKIDRGFVRHITDNRKDLALCEAIIAMAHKLDIRVVAEGIETQEQVRLLREAGCDYGQGYWYSRPLPAEDFERWCRERPVPQSLFTI